MAEELRRSLRGRSGQPLANAYFGAFGNNYVDDGEVKRYRDVLRMPGFDIDEIQGQSFAKSMLEWNLPPIRFENAGTRNVHATWARPSLFTAVLVTDPDDGDFKRTDYDVGAQVDFQIRVQERLPMNSRSATRSASTITGEATANSWRR